jgi:hypothetical protein
VYSLTAAIVADTDRTQSHMYAARHVSDSREVSTEYMKENQAKRETYCKGKTGCG